MAGKDLGKLHQFLQDAGTYYLATEDDGQPRVRPFGTAFLYEDKIYVLTGKVKDVSKQIEKNPKFEISAMDPGGRWIRAAGEFVADDRIEVHKAILEAYPNLKGAYAPGDGNIHTLYLKVDSAVIYSFTEDAQKLEV